MKKKTTRKKKLILQIMRAWACHNDTRTLQCRILNCIGEVTWWGVISLIIEFLQYLVLEVWRLLYFQVCNPKQWKGPDWSWSWPARQIVAARLDHPLQPLSASWNTVQQIIDCQMCLWPRTDRTKLPTYPPYITLNISMVIASWPRV